jgi:dihydrofolate reductase
MRKIVVLTFVSLDGIMQAPGAPDEDREGGFQWGGWTFPYFDETLGRVMSDQMTPPFDLLLGKKTYEIFASHWPKQPESDPTATVINNARKYVVSNEPMDVSSWKGSVLVTGDVVAEIQTLKTQEGPMLQVHGSSNLIQTLLKHDLVDELWLKTFPVTLGSGKRLFGEGTIPAAFKLLSCASSPSGVVTASYQRAGEVTTGSFA